ncbi:MAG: bifunctional phosphopantothenoylcysteine decarboxylase/phosphopantothenate--cysteine ligase CoaBC [Chloroflexi bacterium]|nr:bifunctional phosphopantothenoylcysteine decarboxylase/phosphopantothenate--cysteine ligase CoaBC [Chloroflexota bacterium]
MISKKNIVLGITGGIAAYKAADIASKLTQAGHTVDVVMTEAGEKFIAPLTLRNITGRPVVTDMFELDSEFSVEHIALSEKADAVLIAPATANTIAKLALGIADNLLGCVVLATRAPVILAPAMNDNMYSHPATQENLARLRQRGFIMVEPETGRLASGKIGRGRLADVARILETVARVLGQSRDLEGKRVVVTAGGTQEPIDPVRHIGNRSSGKMGYALAEAARARGAGVRLVSAPVALPDPAGVEVVHVRTAAQMKEAVSEAVRQADVLIMAAAVADYRPKSAATSKLKKEGSPALTLELVRTPDILREVKGDFVRVGFAAESDDLLANARRKLEEKGLALIVANDISQEASGFDVDNNKVTLLHRNGRVEDLPLMSKREVADKILDRVGELLGKKG